MSIPELETPQFSSFVGTDGPELRAVRFLPERTAPALVSPIRPDKRRPTISDGLYAAARVGVDSMCTCIALMTALGALHLTGVPLVGASPGAFDLRALEARGVSTGEGRCRRHLSGPLPGDDDAKGNRLVFDAELQHALEDQPSAA